MSLGGHLNGLQPTAVLAQSTITNSARGNAVFFMVHVWGMGNGSRKRGSVEGKKCGTEVNGGAEGERTLLKAEIQVNGDCLAGNCSRRAAGVSPPVLSRSAT